jgi:hypothetical protein
MLPTTTITTKTTTSQQNYSEIESDLSSNTTLEITQKWTSKADHLCS